MASFQRQASYLIQMVNITKFFGSVRALSNVDFSVGFQEIVGLLGDNGAGKSTLIKILCGIYPPDEGEIFIEGQRIKIKSPQQARSLGIEAVYQDLALIPMMSIARNFWLGREPVRSYGFIKILDHGQMDYVAQRTLADLGINLRSTKETVASLSGGERQCIAIARALNFGTKLLILDEPTSALSLKEASKVLSYVLKARERGLSVIFITHNLHHVWPLADRIVVLHNGIKVGDWAKKDITPEKVENLIIYGS